MTFPISFDVATYNPLIVKNTGTPDNFSVRCLETMLSNGGTGSPLTNTPAVSWEIGEGIPGGSSLNLTTQWGLADEQGAFNRATCAVTRWTGSAWDITAAMLGAATGANPYKRIRNGVTGVGFFGVASSVPPTLTDFGRDRDVVLVKNSDEESNAIAVFPNPASDVLNVSFLQSENCQVSSIVLSDLSGKTMLKQTSERPDAAEISEQFDVSSFVPGVYVLQMMTTKGIVSKKVVITHD